MSVGSKWNKYGTAPKNMTDEACAKAFEALRTKVSDVLPMSQHDQGVLNDDDALIKFLIARRYQVPQAEEMLRGSLKWRKEFGCEKIFSETFDKSLAQRWPSGFYGIDKEQHPVYIEQPDATNIRDLLNEFGDEKLFRWHIYSIERQRQIMKHWGSDRISIILDARKITMSVVTNMQAVGFLKRISAHDQNVYPEGMRFMFIVNAPMAVSVGWKLISPLLDPVVREKIHIWGYNFMDQIKAYIDPKDLPQELGGQGGNWYVLTGDPSEYKIPEPPSGIISPTKAADAKAAETPSATAPVSSPSTSSGSGGGSPTKILTPTKVVTPTKDTTGTNTNTNNSATTSGGDTPTAASGDDKK